MGWSHSENMRVQDTLCLFHTVSADIIVAIVSIPNISPFLPTSVCLSALPKSCGLEEQSLRIHHVNRSVVTGAAAL